MRTIAVIGGGASGLMAAIAAAHRLKSNSVADTRIVILERLDRVGKKILATGNGRCNLSNRNLSPASYYNVNNKGNAGRELIQNILGKYPFDGLIDMFNTLGLMCDTLPDGRAYPVSNQATTMLDVLRQHLAANNIHEICSFEVTEINRDLLIRSKNGKTIKANAIILALGGTASPHLGSNGSGFTLAHKLGHRITATSPALVQLKSSSPYVKPLNGIRIQCGITAHIASNALKTVFGELLFTEYGFSGICIFELSRIFSVESNRDNSQRRYIAIDLLPKYSAEYIFDMLHSRAKGNVFRVLGDLFVGILNKKISHMLLKSLLSAKLTASASELSVDELRAIAATVKKWEFDISGTMPWSGAQVTAGGIDCGELDKNTLESTKIPNLFFAGEIIDVDGDCGGYNLHWAWATGCVAGNSAADKF